MTLLISAVGVIGRLAGALLTTSLGWASTLMFGRVRSSHQIFVVSMLAGSLVWLLLLVGALAPGLPNIMLDLTPHPAFIDRSLVRLAFLVGLVIVPLGVGLAGYLVPADGERPARPPRRRRGPAWLPAHPGPRRAHALPAGRRNLSEGPEPASPLVGHAHPDRGQAKCLRPAGPRPGARPPGRGSARRGDRCPGACSRCPR